MKKDLFKFRGYIILAFMAGIFFIFVIRLFSIQVVDSKYAGTAERNVREDKDLTPPRGNIYNRYAQLYVSNSPMFNLMVHPRRLEIPDTSLLCQYLEIKPAQLAEATQRMKKVRGYSRFKKSILIRNIDPQMHAVLQENLWNFKGLSFEASSIRDYQIPVGANFLGYISEVSQSDIDVSDHYFKNGDMKGKSGLEQSQEDILNGTKGKAIVLMDVHNREVGSFAGGREDVAVQEGRDLMLGIDTGLQALGEELMQNKKGSIVAIEPSTGEILAFVSAPSYNPKLLTGRNLNKNWKPLRNDPLQPLFNRPLMAEYPPGSIFKIALALTALNEGTVFPKTFYGCGGGFSRNKGKPGCHAHPYPLNLENAIRHSCNAYFAAVYMDFLQHDKFNNDIYKAFNVWHAYMEELGVGVTLGVDIKNEKAGFLPTSEMYDDAKRWYGHTRWGASTIISNAIGQGEILMTPLQMANFAAIVANRGQFYYPPHFVKAAKEASSQDWEKVHFDKKNTRISYENGRVVVDAMARVVSSGTGRRAIVSNIEICGKTGTVQNPHGEDHATFIAFAPKEAPRIAIAVVVENTGGGGGRWAAPIAGIMTEYYINRSIKDKKFEYNRIRKADFITPKKSTPRRASQ